jgi:AcrR family transcriptional regulator
MEVEKNALKIKLAARDLFRKYGFNKTSVNEIAKKANVAKATIYKYYESKELILKNIILDYLEHMFNEISQQFRNNELPIPLAMSLLVGSLSANRPMHKSFYETFPIKLNTFCCATL